MPTFAELKAKAAGAATSGKEKFNHVRDRNTSVPMAKTNWDPYSGESAPPPPPPRSLVNSKTKPKPLAPLPPPPSRTSSTALSAASSSKASTPSTPLLPTRSTSSLAPPLPSRGSSSSSLPTKGPAPGPPPPPPRKNAVPIPISHSPATQIASTSGGPPPIVRSTRPDLHNRKTSDQAETIDWVHLTQEDKDVFFSWLDEFFTNFIPPMNERPKIGGSLGSAKQSHGFPTSANTTSAWSHNSPGIPPYVHASCTHTLDKSTSFVLTHPIPTQYGSGAVDLAHYFAPTTPWPTAWYNPSEGPPIPPPLVDDRNHTYTSSWMSSGPSKVIHIGICFSDLSLFWGTIEFSTFGNYNIVHRNAVFLPQPEPLGWQELVNATATYGDTVALFAESFLGSGRYCARGECWDLPSEALKYFLDYDYVPKPVPSISRTHGHLIFEGMASEGGKNMVGRWRGGDDRIRRGDIAEWRRVKIGLKDGTVGSSRFTLGDPDHTSIIVVDCVPNGTPVDGESLIFSDLGNIVVVEQSIGQPPARKEYDLTYFEEGEMWIYRPIGMDIYLGVSDLTAEPPQGLHGLQELRDIAP